MASEQTEENQKRTAIYQMAGVHKLTPFHDVALLDQYAKAYGLEPDEVEQRRFDTVMTFIWLWKEQEEFAARVATARRLMDTPPKTMP